MRLKARPLILITAFIFLAVTIGYIIEQHVTTNTAVKQSNYIPRWLEEAHYFKRVSEKQIKRKVTVAIVDTGLNQNSTEFNSILPGYNVLDKSNNTMDKQGHGTNCAQYIASKYYGVNPYAVILPVKVRENMYDDPQQVSEGIIWATDNGADIISLSLGKAPTKDKLYEGYRKGIDYALKNHKLVIAASGSSGDQVFYPANFPGVICVGAIGSNYNYKFKFNVDDIDIFAFDTKDNISSSYPTAIVSGTVSLLMSIDTEISATGAISIILGTADIVNINGKQIKVLNIDRAIEKVKIRHQSVNL